MSTKSIVNWINKTFDFTHLLKSRIVLYIFFILSIAQLYTYSVTYDYLHAAIFLLVGFLVSFFSKNMIVIMCFALSLSYMLKYGDSMRNMQEGMETKEGNMSEEDHTSTKIDEISDSPSGSEDKKMSKEMPNAKEKMSINKETIKEAMSKATPGMDKETQMEYKSLLELQLKLIDGISNMQPVLSEVAQKIDSMKKSMKLPN
jgi:hypothetical protein